MSRSLKLTEVQREGAQTDPAEASNRRKVGKGKPTNITRMGEKFWGYLNFFFSGDSSLVETKKRSLSDALKQALSGV
jgi:hypothetical protein